MASLDKFEGGLFEGVGLVILAALLYLFYVAYRGGRSLSDVLSSLLGGGWTWRAAVDPLQTATPGVLGFDQGAGPGAQIYTGSSLGSASDQAIIDAMRAAGESEEYIAEYKTATGLVGN